MDISAIGGRARGDIPGVANGPPVSFPELSFVHLVLTQAQRELELGRGLGGQIEHLEERRPLVIAERNAAPFHLAEPPMCDRGVWRVGRCWHDGPFRQENRWRRIVPAY